MSLENPFSTHHLICSKYVGMSHIIPDILSYLLSSVSEKCSNFSKKNHICHSCKVECNYSVGHKIKCILTEVAWEAGLDLAPQKMKLFLDSEKISKWTIDHVFIPNF